MRKFKRKVHRSPAEGPCGKGPFLIHGEVAIHEAKGLRATFLQTPTWDPESKKIILTLVDLCSQAA